MNAAVNHRYRAIASVCIAELGLRDVLAADLEGWVRSDADEIMAMSSAVYDALVALGVSHDDAWVVTNDAINALLREFRRDN